MGNEARRRALLLKTTDFDTIESMLQDPDPYAAPLCLPIDFLKAITLDFSREQELGRGGHGVVYKVFIYSLLSPSLFKCGIINNKQRSTYIGMRFNRVFFKMGRQLL